jgi:rhamnosyltransferase
MKTAELVSFPARSAGRFPTGGRRLLIYVVYDPRGDVERYIPHALDALRAHCDRIVVVVNGLLTDHGRAALEPVSDDIVVRENRGFDIWGYKEGLEFVGSDVDEFDELILANDTWFGPVRPFGPVFERMDARPLHFWGMTDHMRVEVNTFSGSGYLPYHLQSYWLAVRRDMFLSSEWRAYWRDLPELVSYIDAVAKHESVFTEMFTDFGFVGEVAFPTFTDKIENHSVLYAEQLLDAGCPTLKRRPFFQWPVFLDRAAVIGRWTLDTAERYGFPIDLVYEDLARNVAPRVLNADAAMLAALPDVDVSYDPDDPLRLLVVAHIYYVEMTDEIFDRADALPGAYDVIVTTPDKARAEKIRRLIAARPSRGSVDVRVIPSNNGRDQAAFLIACRDELLGDAYDLVVKIHSKKTPQDAFNVGRHFKLQQYDNLLGSPGYAANVVALFQRESGLGLAFPPTIHLGHPTMGHGWWANKPAFTDLAARLGIRVPLDEISPLAPYGSMFYARPKALRLLAEQEWTYDDFGGAEAYVDGGLAHVLERMPAYAAGELGYHSRTIASADYLASSYTALDFNLDQMSSTMPETTQHQIEFLRRAGYMGDAKLMDFVRMYFRLHHSDGEERFHAFEKRTRAVRGAFWNLRHPGHLLRRR